MARPKFTEDQCKEFAIAACPPQWLMTADNLHDQAVELRNRQGGEIITKQIAGQPSVSLDLANKATFLLCAFALENAIKAFLVYEHPEWISDGYLHEEICSHKLSALADKSNLIPYRNRDRSVLKAFEEGNESWMRYPCSRRASDLQEERELHGILWIAYLRVMRGYGTKLMRLLRKQWRGPHGTGGAFHTAGGGHLGAPSGEPLLTERPLPGAIG